MSIEFLERVLKEKIGESDVLEFKDYYFENGKLNKLDQKNLNDLFKEICSFANYNGGKIILGLKEDEKHNPSKFSDVGVNKDKFETWEQSFRDKISVNTIPTLYGVKLEHISIDENTNCIIIEVPRSELRPHAFYTGSNHEFYIRNGNTCAKMKYNDLKNSFNELSFKQERIKRFIDERIAFILNGNLEESLTTNSSLVLHIIPEWSLDESNFLNLSSLQYKKSFTVFSPSDKLGTTLYNSDGLIRVYGNRIRNIQSYTQLFSNSCIESVEIRLLNDYEDGNIYNWNELEKLLVEKMHAFLIDLEKIDVIGGKYITVTLLNVRDKQVLYNEWGDKSEKISHNIVKTPILKWTPEQDFPEFLYPILTSLAYTCGLNHSSYYDKDGNPIKEKFDFLQN